MLFLCGNFIVKNAILELWPRPVVAQLRYVFHQVDFITVNFKIGLFSILCLFGICNYVIHTAYLLTSFKPIKLSQKMPVYTNFLRDNFPVIHLVYFITV